MAIIIYLIIGVIFAQSTNKRNRLRGKASYSILIKIVLVAIWPIPLAIAIFA